MPPPPTEVGVGPYADKNSSRPARLTGGRSDTDFKEAQVAFWLLDSARTNPTVEDILIKTEKSDLIEAKAVLFDWLKRDNLWKIFEEIEQPLIPILEQASSRGILIDRGHFEKMSAEFSAELGELQKKIWKLSGAEFNINSPKQLSEVLFDKLGLKPSRIKKTAAGARSTAAAELEKLKGLHPVVDLLLDYRELEKLRSTYIDAIPPLLDRDNALHTTFVQTGTTTGPLDSSDPNLQ